MYTRILVVEEDPLVAIMLEGYLDALGRRPVGSAETVAEALRHLAEQEIDAAIVDVHLADGETSGPVAKALRAAGIPFLVATGSLDAIDDRALADAPLLTKPFTLDSLEKALADLETSSSR